MPGECPEWIKLVDYGRARCIREAGHDGCHRAVSPYDSRDINWTSTKGGGQ